MLTIVAFLVALGLLIAIHEYGHYRVAVACGVKVLRFSIGMGKPLLRWRRAGSDTEFVLSALPLGGYVRMLDEREGDVPAQDLHRAFNRQPLRKRAAIVAAGPAANLLLAVVLYSVVNWVGLQVPKAVLAAPPAGSLAAQAGLQGGEWVQTLQTQADAPLTLASFEDLRWQLAQAALHGRDVQLSLQMPDGRMQQIALPLSTLPTASMDAELIQAIGITSPWSAAVIGEVMPASAAAAAGLQIGDRVMTVNQQSVQDAAQLRALIRQAVVDGQARPQQWQVARGGQMMALTVVPQVTSLEDGQTVGKIGAFVGAAPEMVTVRKSGWEGIQAGVVKTWEVSVLSLQMMGRMLIGEASLKNLSGPLTIADYAGKSASMGWVQYLLFLALISVSLGVLNLLPLPVLDGGHLMYYLWEGMTGRPVSEVWMAGMQKLGICLLLAMMAIAFFNDISRIWG